MTPKGFFCPNTIEKDPWGSASGQEHIHGLPKQLWETHVYIKGNLKVVFLLYCFINLNLLTNILALYTGISTPPILHRTSIWRKHNSHTLTVTQEKQCCYATPRCSKTSQSQALDFSSFRTETAVHQLWNKLTEHFKQGPGNDKAPPQQKERFCTYTLLFCTSVTFCASKYPPII